MTRAKKWKIFFFIFGVAILGWMVYATGIDKIWQNVKETGLWFIPIIGVWIVVYLLNALASYSIIRDKNTPKECLPSFGKVMKVTISGFAINYITPVVALGGEPYKIIELQENLGSHKATSAILSHSMMHILSHLVFWIVSTFLIVFILNPSWAIIVGCAVMCLIFCFVLYYIFVGYRKGLIVKTFRVLGKIPIVKKWAKKFSQEKLQSLQEIDQNIVTLYTKRKPTFFWALLLEISARVVSCFELYFIAKAVGTNMTVLDSIVLYAGSTLFANILFFSPMQLGTREGGLALTLNMMGIRAGLGVYMGLVMRIRELFWIGIGLILMRIKKSK
ncbi:MAG: flippase-like domain-containing protein [Prevotellaceae bacterium]|jgi:uncharacterized protein (TIRG00374 family)|nr:flippase-like domain-containing protein [Prevotellaceae bacterium]